MQGGVTIDAGRAVQELGKKRVTIAGLGRFGGQIAAARWLVGQGCTVLVTDQAPAEKLAGSLEQLKDLSIEFRLGEHRVEDFIATDLVVASPAIPPANRFLKAAREANIPVTTEIRLFIERCPTTIVGVTGTKGKSTTTAMLGQILKRRFKTWVGGNIGRSLLPDLDQILPTDLVVLELSSFMLHDLGTIRWSPHLAVVTMVAADHLDWHGSREAYVEDKANIVRFQTSDDIAVLNGEDPGSSALSGLTPARVVRFGVDQRRPLDVVMPGRHNQSNAQAAFTAAYELGVGRDDAEEALREFIGLPHRLQLVHESDGVRYFNDSIATIPEAAVAALESFPAKRVLQIVGGYDKGLGVTPMCNALIERAKAVLCIGATGGRLAEIMSQSASQSGASIYKCGDLETAVSVARQNACPGDIVLLSPGFASYDQFVNFEERGEQFATLARGDG
jgi:UDP-N-acetylmuramoylalanine--D-glutamate ligase